MTDSNEPLGDIERVNIVFDDRIEIVTSFQLTDTVTFTYDLNGVTATPTEIDIGDSVITNARFNQIDKLRETARTWLTDHRYEVDA